MPPLTVKIYDWSCYLGLKFLNCAFVFLIDSSVEIPDLSLKNLIPLLQADLISNLQSYAYQGSLPSPPCFESVTWLVSEQLVSVKPDTVRILCIISVMYVLTRLDRLRWFQVRNTFLSINPPTRSLYLATRSLWS